MLMTTVALYHQICVAMSYNSSHSVEDAESTYFV